MFKVLFLLNLKQKLDSVKVKEKIKVPFHLKFITNRMFKVPFLLNLKQKSDFLIVNNTVIQFGLYVLP